MNCPKCRRQANPGRCQCGVILESVPHLFGDGEGLVIDKITMETDMLPVGNTIRVRRARSGKTDEWGILQRMPIGFNIRPIKNPLSEGTTYGDIRAVKGDGWRY
jgi:hypothetical protein